MKSKIFLTALIFLGCTSSPFTGKQGISFLSENQEKSLGNQSYEEVLKNEKKSTDTALTAQVKKVTDRLIAVADKPDFQWEVSLLENKEPNAFCLPGGKMAVYTGIIPLVENEAGLAAVMGHEIGHALARHGGQRITQNLIIGAGMTALSIAAFNDNKNKQYIMAGLGAATTLAVVLPFSRGDEKEADEIGLMLMAKAGYDPSEAPRFWDRMKKKNEGKAPPAFLSTHPSDDNRKALLEGLQPKAMEFYNKSAHKYGIGEKLKMVAPPAEAPTTPPAAKTTK